MNKELKNTIITISIKDLVDVINWHTYATARGGKHECAHAWPECFLRELAENYSVKELQE